MALGLNQDGVILFTTRFIRLFSYGFLAVGLLLYLTAIGLTQFQIGALFTCTLLGDLVITFYLTTTADSYGRKQVLIVGAMLKIFAGVMFALTSNFYLLTLAGIIGVISPTGGEIGPFLAVEQAAITESITMPEKITLVFGWYNVAGYAAQAGGTAAAGYLIYTLQQAKGFAAADAYRSVLYAYAVFGAVKLALYLCLSPAIEPIHTRDVNAPRSWLGKLGLHKPESRSVVVKLSLLFILDAFAGGFVMQTIIVYWFHERWQMDASTLGLMMSAANLLAGVSALVATPLVNRIGAINTMVFTHFPSNIFLLLVPFMPTKTLAVVMLLVRFSISQMDVPARQTYVATVVDPDERSAAGGITNIVRSVGLGVSPLLAGYLLEEPSNLWVFSLPFIISGGLKCMYDILLFVSFTAVQRSGGKGTGGVIQSAGYNQLNKDEEYKEEDGLDAEDYDDEEAERYAVHKQQHDRV